MIIHSLALVIGENISATQSKLPVVVFKQPTKHKMSGKEFKVALITGDKGGDITHTQAHTCKPLTHGVGYNNVTDKRIMVRENKVNLGSHVPGDQKESSTIIKGKNKLGNTHIHTPATLNNPDSFPSCILYIMIFSLSK